MGLFIKISIALLIVAVMLLMLKTQAKAQITLVVKQLPPNTPTTDNIYVAGNFNAWNPAHPDYKLQRANDGSYTITIQEKGTIEYKFTRGSWTTCEGDKGNQKIGNRTYEIKSTNNVVEHTIEGWEDLQKSERKHTATKNVKILSDSFYMPQLNRKRRVWIYLPNDYETSGKQYPVLYMHDGQNVFDEFYSFSGEWGVDETLDDFSTKGDAGIIVVAIDNGADQRLNELTPWAHKRYGGGHGDKYVRFIAETLKPYVDKNYRTLSAREHTGIMGSSLGGLISLYAALQYPDTFGKAGVFSPSLWFTKQIFTMAQKHKKNATQHVYLLAGGRESRTMVSLAKKMKKTLLKRGFSDTEIHLKIVPEGEHNEAFWQREFGEAYQWLWNKK